MGITIRDNNFYNEYYDKLKYPTRRIGKPLLANTNYKIRIELVFKERHLIFYAGTINKRNIELFER